MIQLPTRTNVLQSAFEMKSRKSTFVKHIEKDLFSDGVVNVEEMFINKLRKLWKYLQSHEVFTTLLWTEGAASQPLLEARSIIRSPHDPGC